MNMSKNSQLSFEAASFPSFYFFNDRTSQNSKSLRLTVNRRASLWFFTFLSGRNERNCRHFLIGKLFRRSKPKNGDDFHGWSARRSIRHRREVQFTTEENSRTNEKNWKLPRWEKSWNATSRGGKLWKWRRPDSVARDRPTTSWADVSSNFSLFLIWLFSGQNFEEARLPLE